MVRASPGPALERCRLGVIAGVLKYLHRRDSSFIAKMWTTTVYVIVLDSKYNGMAVKARESEVQASIDPIHNVCLTLAPCLECRHKRSISESESEIQGHQCINNPIVPL